ELAVARFVIRYELTKRLAQPLGRERAQHHAMLEIDFEHLGLGSRLVPVLVKPEIEHHFLARAGGIAHVAITALEVVGTEAKRLPCAGLGRRWRNFRGGCDRALGSPLPRRRL